MTEITDLSTTDSSNTSVSGESLDGAIANMGRMDNTLQAVMGLLARSIRTNVLRWRDNTDATKQVALDLSGLPTATTRTWTAPPYSGTITMSSDLKRGKDFVVNGDMQVSQENVNNSGTTNGFFGADQWATYRVTSAGVITTQRVAARTPAGGSYRYRVTITTPDASLAAGEYLTITQPLEGSNVQAYLYGTASASASVLRFGFNAPAGTYAARFGNSAANRSFVALFTIAGGQANTDTVQNIAIPGDVTGTWLTSDGVIGITLDIVLACGSTFQGATGWQAGNILGTSAVSNGMGTGSAVFELFDVGLKLDPDATGVYGQYEVGEVDPVYRSERYYAKTFPPLTRPANGAGFAGALVAASYAGGGAAATWKYPVTMCKAPPSITVYNPVSASATWRDLTNSADRGIAAFAAVGDMQMDVLAAASAPAIAFNYIHVTAIARL